MSNIKRYVTAISFGVIAIIPVLSVLNIISQFLSLSLTTTSVFLLVVSYVSAEQPTRPVSFMTWMMNHTIRPYEELSVSELERCKYWMEMKLSHRNSITQPILSRLGREHFEKFTTEELENEIEKCNTELNKQNTNES